LLFDDRIDNNIKEHKAIKLLEHIELEDNKFNTDIQKG